jgi:AcrR family transcriptional regulator
MGIKERKGRAKEDLTKLILEAAKALFIEKGFKHTSIRNIAEQIEYSPTTIYLYYKDKDAIFHAIHSEGFSLLNLKMSVLFSVADPFERLKAMGQIYIDFALENRELYDLMFIQDAPMNFIEGDDEENWQEGKTAFEFLKATVQQCMEMGHLPKADVESTAFFIWASMHGMCSLDISCRCKIISDEKREKIVELGYGVMIVILENLKNKK